MYADSYEKQKNSVLSFLECEDRKRKSHRFRKFSRWNEVHKRVGHARSPHVQLVGAIRQVGAALNRCQGMADAISHCTRSQTPTPFFSLFFLLLLLFGCLCFGGDWRGLGCSRCKEHSLHNAGLTNHDVATGKLLLSHTHVKNKKFIQALKFRSVKSASSKSMCRIDDVT